MPGKERILAGRKAVDAITLDGKCGYKNQRKVKWQIFDFLALGW